MLPIGLSYFPASKFVTGNFTRGCLDCWTSDLWWFSILASKISDQYVCLNMLPTWKSLHTTHQLVSSHSLLNQAWFSWLESNGIIGCGGPLLWPTCAWVHLSRWYSYWTLVPSQQLQQPIHSPFYILLHAVLFTTLLNMYRHHIFLVCWESCYFHNIQFTNTLVTIVILAKSMFLPLRLDSKSLAFRRIPPRVAQVQRSPAEFFWILSFLLLR